jgi:hypothetical protein
MHEKGEKKGKEKEKNKAKKLRRLVTPQFSARLVA